MFYWQEVKNSFYAYVCSFVLPLCNHTFWYGNTVLLTKIWANLDRRPQSLTYFFILCTYKSSHKMQTHYLIALTFGTQKESIKAHPGTKFCLHTINTHGVINNYSQKQYQYLTEFCKTVSNRIFLKSHQWIATLPCCYFLPLELLKLLNLTSIYSGWSGKLG